MFGRHKTIASWLVGVAATAMAATGVVSLISMAGGQSTAVVDAGNTLVRTRPVAPWSGLGSRAADDPSDGLGYGANEAAASATSGGEAAGRATDSSGVQADPDAAAADPSANGGAGGGNATGGGGTNPAPGTGSKGKPKPGNTNATAPTTSPPPTSPPPTSPPPPSGPAFDNDCEVQVFDQMNVSRHGGSVRTLLPGAQGDDVPDAWSAHMEGTQRLEHNPSYKSQLDSHGVNWRTVGENVGTNVDLAELHQDWMNSSIHRNNIMNGGFTHAGVGCAQDSNGVYWVTVDFWSV